MSDDLSVYTPIVSSNTVLNQTKEVTNTMAIDPTRLDSSTTLSIQDIVDTYAPRQILLALGNSMYSTAQQELDSAGDDGIKQQQAYLKLAQADRMRNLSAQF